MSRFLSQRRESAIAYLSLQAGHADEACQLVDTVFKMPLHKSTPQKLFRDYSYAAVINYSRLDKVGQVTQWLEKALEEADKYADQAIAVVLHTEDIKSLGDAYGGKAGMKRVLNQPDSAIYYYTRSGEFYEKC